jgi:hypothetical protein
MEIRRGSKPVELSSTNVSIFLTLFSISFLLAGCGVPGDPVPPSPPIPTAVNDLTATQLGDGVLLSFTLPTKSTLGLRLTQTPTLEVFRGSLKPDGTPDTKSFRQVDTVPSSVLGGYVRQGKVVFHDAITPEEPQSHPGELVVYSVRTRVSERKNSADSNFAQVNLYPVPARIGAVDIQVTEKSVQLKWDAPTLASAGGALPSTIAEYHVYRGELEPGSAENAEEDLRAAVWKLPLLQIAAPKAPEYQDAGFDYGKTYVYVVRSVVNEQGVTRESGDSPPAIVTPKDIFPPAAPRDVVAAALPATGGPSVVDLSWSLNVETDLAGYRVYRSESLGARGQSLSPELLPTPAYRDNTTHGGHKYWYTVTAVDRAGNESSPSSAVALEIP